MEWRGKENKLLTMHRLSPTPFSSDEGAESGDDSEEDLVTNYLGNPPPNTQPWEAGGQRSQYQVPFHHQQQQPSVQPAHTHGGGGAPTRRLVRMAELPTVDSVTAESMGMGSNVSSIPSISITPHSPISQKPFAVLSESIRHLQSMQDKIQQMRESNAAASAKSGRALTRLSSSCPSLNVEGEEIEDDDLPSSWSDEFLLDDRKTRIAITVIEQNRRRSWAGLSDEEKKRARQRSVSLSSLDSDTEEPFFDAEDNTNAQGSDGVDGGCWITNDKHRCSVSGSSSPVARKNGGSSTHSLNEAHLDGKKIKRNRSEKPRLLTPRLTLQKSISTPSILAGVINQATQKQANHNELPNRNSYYLPHQDERITSEDGLPHHMLMSHNVLPKKLVSNYQYGDENANSKPRKRGSIFFRKKKDKTKRTSHQFVGVCYSNSATCDVCCKPMTNKPALRCESCLVCVHENSCKDQISDCSKLKNSKNAHKQSGYVGGVENISNATKSASLGSTPGSTFVGGFSGSRSSQPLINTHTRSAAHSSSPTRPYTIVTLSGGVSSPVRRLSGFSQWRRVATKLGVNKVTTEDKDPQDSHQDVADANILDVNSASLESLEDAPETSPEPALDCLETEQDSDLRLLEVEPDLWVKTVDPEVISKLTEKQIKKQEYIYELIMTEKNHCRTLKLIKKLFAEGMQKELGLNESFVKSIFPCLDELMYIHFNFLWRLRERQRDGKYIEKIGDLLLDQFSGENAQGLKEAYGMICSKQPDSIATYKDLQKTDRRFQNFIKMKSSHPLLKKKEVTERWVFTSQRCTKYPLGITEMIKYTKEDLEERETLKSALESIKEILRDINTQVHEKEMRQRLLEIYHKIDAKSFAMYREQKFKKSDLLIDGRKLMFEGTAILIQTRGKLPLVVVVMSDLIFFLQENKEKYIFVTPDNKMGVIPLSKLLVREKADQDKGIYLVNSGNHAEMHLLECTHPINRKSWLDSLSDAVLKCPNDDSGLRRQQDGNSDRIHELIMLLQHHDKEVARVCEDKTKTVCELVSALGGETPDLHSPDYRLLLDEHNLDYESARDLQITLLNEALRSVSSACGWGTNLARSVSSVGEHQSDAYVSPSLPKRAETFGGFDNPIKDNRNLKQSTGKKKKDSKISLLSTETVVGDITDNLKNRRASGSSLTNKCSQDNLSTASAQSGESESSGGGQTQQQQLTLATHLVQCLNSALILSQHHFTQYEILRAKVMTGMSIEGRFSHSQKLEELRNIQEQISQERAQWTREKDNQEKWIADKRDELKRLQETLKSQQEDINQQREDLYRKLEVLKNQGILLNPNLSVLTSSTTHSLPQQQQLQNNNNTRDPSSPNSNSNFLPTQVSPRTSPTGSSAPSNRSRSDLSKQRNSTASLVNLKRDSNPSLPTHLISAAKQQKAAVTVKQQIPMKLAKLAGAGGSGGSSSSSSMSSSSMSSSFGGIMSPNQEQPPGGSRVPMTSPPPSGSFQQMIPLKLSKSSPTEPKLGRMGGYQRLASPPPTDSAAAAAHHRTESSPAMLQNSTQAIGIVSSVQPIQTLIQMESEVSIDTKAARTNTYPKLANKPNLPQVSRISSSEISSTSGTGRYPEVPNLPSSRTGPGQRIKDPDSDQDIIFF